MSSELVRVVRCDRCGKEEHMTENPEPLFMNDVRFAQEHGDWGAVKLGGAYLDLCPSCNQKYKAFFSDFVNVDKPKMRGPLDEKL